MDSNDSDEKPKVVKGPTDLQRLRLEKLMKNPDKPIIIPERPRGKSMPSAPDFVRNVMGSSAGAGSGEFHVYRHLRRKEYARQKFIQERSEKEILDDDYKSKIEENRLAAEAKTAKKRMKRQKKKQNARNKGKKPKVEEIKSESEEESDDDENEDRQDTEPDVPGPLPKIDKCENIGDDTKTEIVNKDEHKADTPDDVDKTNIDSGSDNDCKTNKTKTTIESDASQ